MGSFESKSATKTKKQQKKVQSEQISLRINNFLEVLFPKI